MSTCACDNAVYAHPDVLLHELIVQMSESSQLVVVTSHTPVTALHRYERHAVSAEHDTFDV